MKYSKADIKGLIYDTFKESTLLLSKKFGKDIKKWKLGRIRPVSFVHPFSVKRSMAKIFNIGPISCGGAANSINQCCTNILKPDENPNVVVALRSFIEVGEWDNNSFVIPGGQSGNPCSKHYRDQIPLWVEGKGVTIYFDETKIEQHIKTRLNLMPISKH